MKNTLERRGIEWQKKKVSPRPRALLRPDKTVLKSTALGGMHGGGAPVFVDVKDGKIVRVRPFHYDWKYDMKSLQSLEIREKRRQTRTPYQDLYRPLFTGL